MLTDQNACRRAGKRERLLAGILGLLAILLPLQVAHSACPQMILTNSIVNHYGPNSIAMGRLNADNYPDMVVGDEFNNRLCVFLGTYNGFGVPTFYSLDGPPTAVAIVALGDAPGDFQDIAVTVKTVDQLAVLIGNGDGTFASPSYTDAGYWPVGLAFGDIDEDGHVDCAIANRGTENSYVLWGNGLGGFPSRTSVLAGDSGGALSVAVGPLNDQEDDSPDVAFGTAGTSAGAVYVQLRRDPPLQRSFTGVFPVGPAYVAAHSVAIANLNPWIYPTAQDIAFAGGSTGKVYVCLGMGDGVGWGGVPYNAGTFPKSLMIGDVAGLGYPDIMVADYWGDRVAMLGNRYGSGTYSAPCFYPVSEGPYGIAGADINGDGDLDRFVTPGYDSDYISMLAKAGLSMPGQPGGPQAEESVEKNADSAVAGLTVGSAMPNPTRTSTLLQVTTGAPGFASLDVVDASGRVIAHPWEGSLSAGVHQLSWNGKTAAGGRAPAGIYFLRLRSAGGVVTRTCTMIR